MKGVTCLTNQDSVSSSCIKPVAQNPILSSLQPELGTQNLIPTREKEKQDSTFILIRSAQLQHSTELKLKLESIDSHQLIDAKALLDSGATGLFIDAQFVEAHNLTRNKLPRSLLVYNIDGTLNEHGSIKESVDLVIRYQDHTERATFYITTLGGSELILEHPWLAKHNPEIDWTSGKLTLS